IDGGNWLDGRNVISVAIRGTTILVAIDNSIGGLYADVGIWRSTDGGGTFTQISDTDGAIGGLPAGIAYDLAADPTDNDVFYTAIVGADQFGGENGIYKSSNAGLIPSLPNPGPRRALTLNPVSVTVSKTVFSFLVFGFSLKEYLISMRYKHYLLSWK
ncbi:MAG: hypothetical protein PHX53_13050, partial [Syntrophales bacterium]|nr:hypothetical protein [Syntrophales bacterium]